MDSLGFIGLGAMGLPMSEQLDQKLPANTYIYVNDIANEQVQQLLANNRHGRIYECATAKEVAEKSKVILTMLPEGEHVRDVFLHPETGVLRADLANKLIIDCSTIDIDSSKAVASAIESGHPSARFYDAPVSGGITGAQKGTLTFMVGIDDKGSDDHGDSGSPATARADWAEIKSVLSLMGTSIFACGGPTLGLVTKFCNNYLSGTIAIAASEAMNVGIRMGLDPVRLSDIFRTSTAQNAILDKFHPVPGVDPHALSTNGYAGGFKVQLMKKDYTLAMRMAESVGANMVLGQAGLATYEGASDDPRCRDRDSRVVYRYIGGIEDWKGRKVPDQ